jgi:hypothetical protein
MVNFLFNWVEWINVVGLGSNAILAATGGADYHIGDYATNDGVFLNPVKVLATDTTWT